MIINSTMRSILVMGYCIGGALMVSGCGQKEDAQPPVVVTQTPATPPVVTPPATTTVVPDGGTATTPQTNNTNAAAGGATGTNTAVADQVNQSIHGNAQLTGSRITAVVDDSGVARLTGTAQNKTQKALAAQAASSTPGVTSVVNKVEIVATGGVKETSSPQPTTKVINHYITKKIVIQSPNGDPTNSTGASSSAGTSNDTTTPSPNSNTTNP